jgi:hypothetical protein
MSTATLEEKKAGALSAEEWESKCKLRIQLHAKKARIEARLKDLDKVIKPELQAGRKSPRQFPYLLVLRTRLLTLSDWKESFRQFLQITFKSKEQADKHIDDVQASFPQEESEALCVEINKSYAAKL